MTDIAVVLVTAPATEKAAELARTIVEEKLAACVNLVPGIRSIYRWEGKICDENEALLIIKVPRKRLKELSERIVEIHPYDLPEVVALSVESANQGYVDWVLQSMY